MANTKKSASDKPKKTRRKTVNARVNRSVRVPEKIYEDIALIAAKENTSIQEQFDKAHAFFVRSYNNNRLHEMSFTGEVMAAIKKVETRLANISAKGMMDSATSLELLIEALSRGRSEKEIDDMYHVARTKAAANVKRKLDKEGLDV